MLNLLGSGAPPPKRMPPPAQRRGLPFSAGRTMEPRVAPAAKVGDVARETRSSNPNSCCPFSKITVLGDLQLVWEGDSPSTFGEISWIVMKLVMIGQPWLLGGRHRRPAFASVATTRNKHDSAMGCSSHWICSTSILKTRGLKHVSHLPRPSMMF